MNQNALAYMKAKSQPLRNKLFNAICADLERTIFFQTASVSVKGLSSDDLRQEALLGILDALECFDPNRGDFESIASTIIRNRAINALKYSKNNRRKPLNEALSIDVEPDDAYNSPEAPDIVSLDPDACGNRDALKKILVPLIDDLSEWEKKVFEGVCRCIGDSQNDYACIRKYVQKKYGIVLRRKQIDNTISRIRRKGEQFSPEVQRLFGLKVGKRPHCKKT